MVNVTKLLPWNSCSLDMKTKVRGSDKHICKIINDLPDHLGRGTEHKHICDVDCFKLC